MKQILLPAIALLASLTPTHTLDTTVAQRSWPQWRGPAFNGTAPQGSAPTT